MTPSVYWGAIVKALTYGMPTDPPWDWAPLDRFEANAGKRVSVLGMGQAWHRTSQAGYSGILDGYYQKFFAGDFDKIRQRGALTLFTWGSYSVPQPSPVYDQPTYKLSNITRGDFDAYLYQWALDARNWGWPFFLRFNWEMNGTWYAWSEARNGNAPGDYVAAWRHVHDIFSEVGAGNVTWVWCPNVSYPGSIPLAGLYPGDAYVDWVGVDGYNKDSSVWRSFSDVFASTVAELTALAPSKPIFICEFASNEAGDGGTKKAAWIADALAQVPAVFPSVRAVSWFDWNSDPGSSYVIESSPAAQSAFRNGIASAVYPAGVPAFPSAGSKVVPLMLAAPTPAPTDTIAPSVTILRPAEGSVVGRNTFVTVAAAAQDNVGVVRLDFIVNGVIKQSSTATTYQMRTGPKRNTLYTIEVRAFDAAGNTSRAVVTVRT